MSIHSNKLKQTGFLNNSWPHAMDTLTDFATRPTSRISEERTRADWDWDQMRQKPAQIAENTERPTLRSKGWRQPFVPHAEAEAD